MTLFARLPLRVHYWTIPALLLAQALILLAMGRVPICTCGTVKLWQTTSQPQRSTRPR